MFPTLVYRVPGEHQLPGGTFSTRSVLDQDDLNSALADGWFQTLPEAIDSQIPKDDPPMCREELELKAIELDLKFDGRTSDRKLRDLIKATLEE